MPPRGRGAQNEDSKKAAFAEFETSDAFKICETLYKLRKNDETELGKLEKGTEDIIEEWGKILEMVHKLGESLKIAGRKAKSKLQNRTQTALNRF